jgi:hypothetical protein
MDKSTAIFPPLDAYAKKIRQACATRSPPPSSSISR